jgi:outer membrane lipoprotein carrier protein
MRPHRLLTWLLATGLLALPFAAPAVAEVDAVAQVEAYLAGLKTLQSEFVQVVRDRQGQITDRSTGTLTLVRPGRFRWDYREPYVQTIVADGRKLWLYDVDLMQVTVRPLESGLGSTPAALLSGSERVADLFVGRGSERIDGVTWYRLAPRDDSSDFERVSLAFAKGGELAAMELRDKLGQSTQIDFTAARRNAKLDERVFRFSPPKGADVIGDPN